VILILPTDVDTLILPADAETQTLPTDATSSEDTQPDIVEKFSSCQQISTQIYGKN
jgi:hypothetical protein